MVDSERHRPSAEEIEISIFGRSIGECVVVHLGNDDWVVIDSHLAPDSEQPIALDYLARIGVSPEQVKALIVTHWHTDHIRGMPELLWECPNAKFWCSQALSTQSFMEFIAVHNEHHYVALDNETAVFGECLDILCERAGDPGTGPQWCSEGTRIHRDENLGVYVDALSPSHQVVTEAMSFIASFHPNVDERNGQLPPDDPNAYSVVLSLTCKSCGVLLGADMTVGDDSQHGWAAIVKSGVRPGTPYFAYKVAHHGSPDADSPDIWRVLLCDNPSSIVTSFGGGKPRPTYDDLKRVASKSKEVFCTTWPPNKSGRFKERASTRLLKRMTKSIHAVDAAYGQVRLRFSATDPSATPSFEIIAKAQKFSKDCFN